MLDVLETHRNVKVVRWQSELGSQRLRRCPLDNEEIGFIGAVFYTTQALDGPVIL